MHRVENKQRKQNIQNIQNKQVKQVKQVLHLVLDIHLVHIYTDIQWSKLLRKYIA